MTDNPNTPLHEPDEGVDTRLCFTPRRFLVIALYSCFFATLAAFWFAGNLFGLAGYILPPPLLQTIITLRFVLLLLPLIGMLVCYIFLRNITGDIMACPERYLDERQKMVRDEAHRRAYNIIKAGCVLGAIGFLLHSALTPLPIKGPLTNVTTYQATYGANTWSKGADNTVMISEFTSDGGNASPFFTKTITPSPDQGKQPPGNSDAQSAMQQKQAMQKKLFAARLAVIRYQAPIIFPADPTSITALYGTLLLSLFLMIAALPMALVAWKERY